MSAAFDIHRALRRLKPEKRKGLQRREDGDLIFAASEDPVGGPLLLDTCAYIHVLQAKAPPAVERLLRTRPLLHSGVAVAELAYRFGARLARNALETSALRKLALAIERIPEHRTLCPGPEDWGEAGILAGLHARLSGAPVEQKGLNDALLLVQAGRAGATLLTANIGDFDLLQQLLHASRVVFYRELAR